MLWCFFFVDKAIYDNGSGWEEYREFNFYRARITDNPNAFKQTPQNIDASTYSLLSRFFPDSKAFSNKVLKESYSQIDDVPFEVKRKNLFGNLEPYKSIFLLWGILTLFILVFQPDYRRKALMATAGVLTLTLLFYLSLDNILQPRVVVCANLGFFLVFFYASYTIKKKVGTNIIFVFLLLSLSFSAYRIHCFTSYFEESKAIYRQDVKDVFKQASVSLSKDEFFVPFAGAIALEEFNPFTLSAMIGDKQFVVLGWLTKSGLNENRLESYLDLVDKNMICIGHHDLKLQGSNLQESILVNYGINTTIEVVSSHHNVCLIRLNKIEE